MTKQEIILSILAIFLLGSCKNGGKDKEYILIPGVGFNSISLGKSTSDDIIKHLGTDFSIDTFYWRPPFKKEILSIGINYVDLGITFYFAPNEKYV
jgi:hypothetical protein